MGYRNPEEPTEFELQAEVYMYLKGFFPYVRGEYHWTNPEGRNCILDIAFLNCYGDVLAVIEVKRPGKKPCYKQNKRYEKAIGVPVLNVCSFDEVGPPLQDRVNEAIDKTLRKRAAEAQAFFAEEDKKVAIQAQDDGTVPW